MDKFTIRDRNPNEDDISRNATDIAEMDIVPVKKAREYFFKESWQEQFPWVEYYRDKDAIFCKVCRWFKDSGKHWMTRHQRNTFVTEGFTQFKYALQKTSGLSLHDKSAQHEKSKFAHAWFLGHQVGLEVMLNEFSLKLRKQGRQAMKIIFDLVKLWRGRAWHLVGTMKAMEIFNNYFKTKFVRFLLPKELLISKPG